MFMKILLLSLLQLLMLMSLEGRLEFLEVQQLRMSRLVLLRMLHKVVLKKLLNMLMKMFLVVLLSFLALFGDLMRLNFIAFQKVLHHQRDQGLFLLSLWLFLAPLLVVTLNRLISHIKVCKCCSLCPFLTKKGRIITYVCF